jgi:signal transduction histidine kinase
MTEPRDPRTGLSAGLFAEGEGPRALVVDDNEALLLVCVRTLSKHGYRVEAAQDAEAALRALRRTSFDVLVSDIHMPGMSGTELLKQVRADGLDIPVVLVTGEPSLDSAMKAMEHGVFRYLAKPVAPSALVVVVNEVVRLHGIERAQRLALDNDALRSLVEELGRSKDAALAGVRAKREFLSNMGHELRTPMTGIMGMTELALETELTPDGRGYLETVKTCANALMDVIAHVLDLSDLDGGMIRLDATPFSVRDVIDVTLKPLQPHAEEKGLSLTWDVASGIPDALIGDPVRFGQIVKSLVSNAIKFTRKGEVRICAQLEAHLGDEVCVCVSISDTGIGIPQEALARVLEAFTQQDNSSTREYGGAGLGLTIASELAALMKGSLKIESTPDVGTTVRFFVCFEPPVSIEDMFFMLDSGARSEASGTAP